MKNQRTSLQNLANAVYDHDEPALQNALEQAEKVETKPGEILAALSRGLDRAREKLADPALGIPEFLFCADVFTAGAKGLQDNEEEAAARPVAVIGVVEGDVHDLGKNIVAAVLAASGYEVRDLGLGVTAQEFAEAVQESKAKLLALSSMMSTPMANMQKIVELCREKFPKLPIIVGGAALDGTIAQNMGAHGYAENATQVPEVLDSLKKRGRAYMDYEQKVQVVENP